MLPIETSSRRWETGEDRHRRFARNGCPISGQMIADGLGNGRRMSSTVAENPLKERRFSDAQIVGMVFLAGGGLWLLDTAGLIAVSLVSVLAILLIILGTGMMLSGGRPQRWVIVAGIVIVSSLIGASFLAPNLTFSDGSPVMPGEFSLRGVDGAVVGDVTLAPSSVEELQGEYSFGVGDVTLDLSRVDFPAGETPLSVRMGVGHLSLVLPSDVAVRGHAEMGAGEITLFGRRLSAGTGGSSSFDEPAATPESADAVLLLEIKGGLGEIEVFRAGF